MVRLIVDIVSIPPGRVSPANDATKVGGSCTCSITSNAATRSYRSPYMSMRCEDTGRRQESHTFRRVFNEYHGRYLHLYLPKLGGPILRNRSPDA